MDANQLLLGFLLALAAAVLTTVGNRVLLSFQTKAKVREELREFVRSLHSDTVDIVADLDLFLRELRPAALVGPEIRGGPAAVKATVKKRWEKDLMRRVRRLRFGHPDPDVRDMAEFVEDSMWSIIMLAEEPREGVNGFPPTSAKKRSDHLGECEVAMTLLRNAVYRAPHRDVPRKVRYRGLDIPSRLSRALAAEGKTIDDYLGPDATRRNEPPNG